MVVLTILKELHLTYHAFEPARRCRACESGMEAPGIKHTKACRKRFSKFEEHRKKERRVEPGLSPGSPMVVPQMPVPVEEVDEGEVETTPGSAQQQPETQVEYTRTFKRKAETDREQLEENIARQAPPCHYHDCHSEWGALSAKVPIGDCPEVKAAPYP